MTDPSAPLWSPRLKVYRAKAHIRDAEAASLAFLRTDPFCKEWRVDESGTDKHLFIKATAKPPREIAAIVGDAAHNLRSALDHLACDLAVFNGATVVKDVHFPFFKKGVASSERSAKEKIRKLSAAAQSMILALKPYKGGNDTLYSINELDALDKHQTIVTAVGAGLLNTSDFGYDQPITLYTQFGGRLDEGQRLLSVPKIANGYADTQLSTYVAFGDIGVCEGEAIIATLDNFADLVTSILNTFEKAFFS